MPGVRAAAALGLALGLTFAFALSGSGASLLVNGSFEDAGLSMWSASGASLAREAAADAPDGDYVLAVDLAGSGRVTQIVPAVATGSHELGAFVALAGGSGRARVVADWRSDRDGYGRSLRTDVSAWSAATDGVFRELSVAAQAPSDARSARVSVEFADVAGALRARVDAVRLEGPPPSEDEPTPEAATAAPSATPSATTEPSSTPLPTGTPTATSTPGPGFELRNPGFEDVEGGSPAWWRKYGGELASSDQARSGGHSGRLESATDSTKWAYQVVLVESEAWYEFAAWVLSDDPGVAGAFLRISWYASSDGSGEAMATSDSTEVLTAPAPGFRRLSTGPAQAPPRARSAKPRIVLSPAGAAHAAILMDDASWGRTEPPLTPTPTATATPSPVPTFITASGPAERDRATPVGRSVAEVSPLATRHPLEAGGALRAETSNARRPLIPTLTLCPSRAARWAVPLMARPGGSGPWLRPELSPLPEPGRWLSRRSAAGYPEGCLQSACRSSWPAQG